ncbi:MAG TPA: hypothetical protein VN110_05675 [Sphingobium sp.]|nr:hypothetical protein [Sphingobium sp.]
MMMVNPFSLMIDSWMLGMEAGMVIALRIPKLLTGDPAAAREAHLMVAEKIEAVGALQWRALTGTLGADPHTALGNSIAHYRKGVARNQRRLSRRK